MNRLSLNIINVNIIMYKLYTSSYVYCYLVFYALESAVRPLGERRYTKQPLLLYYYLLRSLAPT